MLAGEASWDDPLERHADFLTDYVGRQGVQTNEVQRSWVLLPLFQLLARSLRVRSRVGIDRAPVDVTTAEGARLLESFVWAGQDERMARLRAAIEIVREAPPPLVAGDVVDVLPDVLESLPPDGLTLVFQTSLFEYLTADARARVRELLDASDRNLVFVASGSPRNDLRSWGMRIHRPGREREFVGHADYHGTWLDYSL